MKALVALLVAGVSCAGFWAFFPTEIPARTRTYMRVSDVQFEEARTRLSDFARNLGASGVVMIGSEKHGDSVALKCKSLPLVTVFRHDDTVLVQLFESQLDRIPEAGKVLSAFESLGDPIDSSAAAASGWKHSTIARFVLKHRDGIDLDDTCLQ